LNPNDPVSATNQIIRRVELYSVIVERGLIWDKALELFSVKSTNENEGFYISNQVKNNHRMAILVLNQKTKDHTVECGEAMANMFCIYRPNTGLQVRQETLETLKKKYKKVSSYMPLLYYIC
jgi:hypothetical protein